jgi:hypothetical protein
VRFAQINKRFSTWGGWTELETNRLYWAVRYFGSDFDTMQSALFWNRTRADIKRKVTLELRRRPWLVDHALEVLFSSHLSSHLIHLLIKRQCLTCSSSSSSSSS